MSCIPVRQLLLSLALLLFFEAQPVALAQGQILFRTHVSADQVDAQATFAPTAQPVSAGFTRSFT